MRNVSSAFMRALAEDKRDWICTATITLVQNIYSYPKVKKNMRYRISGTYSSVSLGGAAITVTEGRFTAPDDGVLTITGGTSSGDTPTVIRQILDIDNSHIWENGFKIEDAVSADNLFEIGGAIINQATLVLNNIYDEFTEYDFFGANVVMHVGLEVGETVEYIKMGTFLVDEAKYNSSLLTLTCLDYMTLFDTPGHYNGGTYLGTPSAFLQVACERCGVTLATPNFPNKDIEVYATLSGNTSYRQVVSWVAQIAGCYARMNVDGELELNFYDFDALEGITEDGLNGGVFDEGSPYASGDSADGGSFNPWDTTGDTYDGGSFTNMPNVHVISSDYSHNLSMDDIVITGVKVIEKVGDFAFQYASPYHNNQSYAVGNWCRYNNNLYECVSPVTAGTEFDESKWKQLSVIEHTSGSEGYMVVIDGNEMTHGKQTGGTLTGQVIANLLGIALIDRTFRQASISHPSDPTIEAGDVALFIDRKGYQYPIVVSSTTFSNGDAQSTTSSAQTPQKNSSQKYSASTKNYVAMREQLSGETAYIENTINDKIANAGGLYETYTTNVKTGEGLIWHLHDKQNLAESNIVMMFSDVGFTLTSNYQDNTPTWYGLTVDGDLIARYLSADGVNADWIDTGTIIVRDAYGNETFYANYLTGEVRINASYFSLTGGQITSSWSGSEIPTNNNYPANAWNTTALREQHLDDIYYDETGGTGIYKYSKYYNGLVIHFTGTYSHTGTGDRIVFAFLYDGYWYTITNPFEDGDVDKTIFIPTQHTYSSGGVAYPAFLFSGLAGSIPNLNYTITVGNDVFPDAVKYGTTKPFNTYANISREINTEYTYDYSPSSGGYSVLFYVNTALSPNVVYGWENIGIAGDDEYARSLAQQASTVANNANTTANSANTTANNASNAVATLDSSLYGEPVLRRLTNNYSIDGMWIENNRLYIQFTSAKGGTLILGGSNNTYGTLQVQNGSGTVVANIDKDAFTYTSTSGAYIGQVKIIGGQFSLENRHSGRTMYDRDFWIYDSINASTGKSQVFISVDERYVEAFNISELGLYTTQQTSQWRGYDNNYLTFGMYSNWGMYLYAPLIIYGDSYIYKSKIGYLDVVNIAVSNVKSRVVDTDNYAKRMMYCYETPTPYFGDIGTGITDENGEAFISIDDIFDETVNVGTEYCVFLQKEGPGDIWVDEKNHSYFIVKGTPNLKFSWELKAVQKGFETVRSDDYEVWKSDDIPEDDLEQQLDRELSEYGMTFDELPTLDEELETYDRETEELYA